MPIRAFKQIDVFTATPVELAAWCRDGTVTDAKTLTCALRKPFGG